MTSHQDAFQASLTSFAREFTDAVQSYAAKINMAPDAFRRAAIGEIVGEERFVDGRALLWRVRVRLYECFKDDPEFDTDDGRDPGLPRATSFFLLLLRRASGGIGLGDAVYWRRQTTSAREGWAVLALTGLSAQNALSAKRQYHHHQ